MSIDLLILTLIHSRFTQAFKTIKEGKNDPGKSCSAPATCLIDQTRPRKHQSLVLHANRLSDVNK